MLLFVIHTSGGLALCFIFCENVCIYVCVSCVRLVLSEAERESTDHPELELQEVVSEPLVEGAGYQTQML